MFSRSLVHSAFKLTKILKTSKTNFAHFWRKKKTTKEGAAWGNINGLWEKNETELFCIILQDEWLQHRIDWPDRSWKPDHKIFEETQ